jgi:broad-specificity NMP kinase
MTSRIVIVTGPPGAGKSTTARALAEKSDGAQAVHIHTDDFYLYIRKGFVEPWREESYRQNFVIADALTAAAAAYARARYDVLVDGVIGPWLLQPWLKVARAENIDLRYIVLRPSEASTLAREASRNHPQGRLDEAVMRKMWAAFSALGAYEAHVLDTTSQDKTETAAVLLEALRAGKFKLE